MGPRPGSKCDTLRRVTATTEVIVESPTIAHRLAAELFGTFWLVLGCGSAVFAHREILEWIGSLPGAVAAVYEAGPTGFGLARFLLGAQRYLW